LPDLDVVTGAFSYTGRAIAAELLARGRRVRTLSRTPSTDPRIESRPFDWDDLVPHLEGATTLYNTYWIRFPHGGSSFPGAVENTRRLFAAAHAAGVEKVVHVSVTNATESSPLPYFRGKALVERDLRESGVRYAIVRPTLVFGPKDILVNNIAWVLRRFPAFFLPADGDVQPVSVEDTARICVEAADGTTVDAAGPETYSFRTLVERIGEAIGGRARIVRAPASLAWALSRAVGAAMRDVMLTREEIAGLDASLLVSHAPPLGHDSFRAWLAEHADELGRQYVSELRRNYR
jgi:NADH dehydrogenase